MKRGTIMGGREEGGKEKKDSYKWDEEKETWMKDVDKEGEWKGESG